MASSQWRIAKDQSNQPEYEENNQWRVAKNQNKDNDEIEQWQKDRNDSNRSLSGMFKNLVREAMHRKLSQQFGEAGKQIHPSLEIPAEHSVMA